MFSLALVNSELNRTGNMQFGFGKCDRRWNHAEATISRNDEFKDIKAR